MLQTQDVEKIAPANHRPRAFTVARVLNHYDIITNV
jgi:hypothetical protein